MIINNATSTAGVSSIQPNVDQLGAKRPSSMPPPPTAAASTNISSGGTLMAKLAELAQRDPAKLKQVLSSIASGLKQAEGQNQGGGRLDKLADRFAAAAQSGDLSALQPKEQAAAGAAGGGHAHRHHHHGGGGGGAMQAVFSDAMSQVEQALSGTPVAAPVAAPAVAAPDQAE